MNDDIYHQRVEKPWGHEIIWTPPDLARAGKLLHVKAGHRLSLQYHDQKEETILLFSGQARLHLGDDLERLQVIEMTAHHGYTIRPFKIHRLEAVTDCVFVEVSSPETGTTFRLQDDHQRPHETEELRRKERGQGPASIRSKFRTGYFLLL